jgi:hypothetical protein
LFKQHETDENKLHTFGLFLQADHQLNLRERGHASAVATRAPVIIANRTLQLTGWSPAW